MQGLGWFGQIGWDKAVFLHFVDSVRPETAFFSNFCVNRQI
jgi:hypothetical protein